MKITLQQISDVGHLVGVLRRMRNNHGMRTDLINLLAQADNFRVAWEVAVKSNEPLRQEAVGAMSGLYSDLPLLSRRKMVQSADWAKRAEELWPNTLIIDGNAKMVRSVFGAALSMPAKQRAAIIARSICRCKVWDQMLAEALQQLPRCREAIEQREFAIDPERFEGEDPCALEVVVATVGQSYLMGYLPVPQVGSARPEAVQVGGYEVAVEGREVTIKDPARGLESRFKHLPWILRRPESVERAGEVLDVLFRAWAVDDELSAVIRFVVENSQDVKAAVASIWGNLAKGVQHWVPLDGQVKLRVRGSMSRAGFSLIELHPGEFPSMRLRIHLLTYGFLDERWGTLDENGLLDLVDANSDNPERQALYLTLNLDVVQWLHRFATSGTGKQSTKSRRGKARGGEPPERADGLPAGYQFPGYMRTRGNMSEDYAAVRCQARGMPLPAKGSHLTYREYPAGKRKKPLEAVDLVKIDVTYDLDHE